MEDLLNTGLQLLESGEEVMIRRSAWCRDVDLTNPVRLRQFPATIDLENPLTAFSGCDYANVNFQAKDGTRSNWSCRDGGNMRLDNIKPIPAGTRVLRVSYRANWTNNTDPYVTGIQALDQDGAQLQIVGYPQATSFDVKLKPGERLVGISSRYTDDNSTDANNAFHNDLQFLIGFK